jgi:hypothetical protein
MKVAKPVVGKSKGRGSVLLAGKRERRWGNGVEVEWGR